MMKDRYWVLRSSVETFDRLADLVRAPGGIFLQNEKELAAHLFELRHAYPLEHRGDIALPDGFVRPQLEMPERDFSLDYFRLGRYRFASKKFRKALAQPEGVVQYRPIDLVKGGEEVKQHDYYWFRVLAWQPAMDLQRSVCEIEQSRDRVTGESCRYASGIDRLVLLPDFGARTEIFYVAETFATILVSDALAERILRAGCTGVEFIDPETVGVLNGVKRYRTADGIGERVLG